MRSSRERFPDGSITAAKLAPGVVSASIITNVYFCGYATFDECRVAEQQSEFYRHGFGERL